MEKSNLFKIFQNFPKQLKQHFQLIVAKADIAFATFVKQLQTLAHEVGRPPFGGEGDGDGGGGDDGSGKGGHVILPSKCELTREIKGVLHGINSAMLANDQNVHASDLIAKEMLQQLANIPCIPQDTEVVQDYSEPPEVARHQLGGGEHPRTGSGTQYPLSAKEEQPHNSITLLVPRRLFWKLGTHNQSIFSEASPSLKRTLMKVAEGLGVREAPTITDWAELTHIVKETYDGVLLQTDREAVQAAVTGIGRCVQDDRAQPPSTNSIFLCNENVELVSAEELVYAAPVDHELKRRCKEELAKPPWNLTFVHPELVRADAPALVKHTTLRTLHDIVVESVEEGTEESSIFDREEKLGQLVRSKEFGEAYLALAYDGRVSKILSDALYDALKSISIKWVRTLKTVLKMRQTPDILLPGSEVDTLSFFEDKTLWLCAGKLVESSTESTEEDMLGAVASGVSKFLHEIISRKDEDPKVPDRRMLVDVLRCWRGWSSERGQHMIEQRLIDMGVLERVEMRFNNSAGDIVPYAFRERYLVGHAKPLRAKRFAVTPVLFLPTII